MIWLLAKNRGGGHPSAARHVEGRTAGSNSGREMQPATTNWRQRIRDAANRAGLARFWRWWTSELASLLPAASRAIIERRFARPVIELADGEAVFWRSEFADGATR